MKKRFKLFASIASLCVAVALLVFGVYAASSVTYKMNATATYKFDQALVSVTRTVEKAALKVPVTGANKTAPTATAIEDAVTADDDVEWVSAGENLTFTTVDTATGLWKDPTAEGLTYTSASSTAEESYDFDFNTAYVYKVTISVTSSATAGAKVAYTLPTTLGNSNVYLVGGTSTIDADGTVVTTEAKTIVYYVGLIDQYVNVGENVTLGSVEVVMTNGANA